MAINSFTVPPIDDGRIGIGDSLATRDAILTLRDSINQLALQIAGRIANWVDEAYNAANFTSDAAGSWTVGSDDQLAFSWLRIDELLLLHIALATTTIGNATTSELRIALPRGFVGAGSTITQGVGFWNNGTAGGPVRLQLATTGTLLSCKRLDTTGVGANFPQGSGNDLSLGFVASVHLLSPSGN